MKKILFAVAALALIGSCKKKDPSPTEYLTNGKWKLTSATFLGVDISSDLKDCQKDNLYTFNSNKSITAYEGATKCYDTVADSKTDGNWALTSADKQLTLSGSSIAESFGITGNLTVDVVTLNETTLSVKKDTAFSGFSGTVNMTFSDTQ
ncbi:lipocalin family protein [Rurimicrobium arvi]|uniref:Lipocalin-like domain-containing protein n=1 Tax=Rurimicrobium arvi TaxID=2049916 RepID=A0ABP8MJ07_9BACT